jgi:hypothetical protein
LIGLSLRSNFENSSRDVSKSVTCFESGQKWPKNNHFTPLQGRKFWLQIDAVKHKNRFLRKLFVVVFWQKKNAVQT